MLQKSPFRGYRTRRWCFPWHKNSFGLVLQISPVSFTPREVHTSLTWRYLLMGNFIMTQCNPEWTNYGIKYCLLTFNDKLRISDWQAFHIFRTVEQMLTASGSLPSDSSSGLHFMTRANDSDLLKVFRWRIRCEGRSLPTFANSSASSSSQGTSHIILLGFESISSEDLS